MAEQFGVDLALIIMDTVAAAAGFTNENDAAEGQRVMTVLACSGAGHRGGCPRPRPLREGRQRKARVESSAKEASADFISPCSASAMTPARSLTRGWCAEAQVVPPVWRCLLQRNRDAWPGRGRRSHHELHHRMGPARLAEERRAKKTKKLSQAASDLQQAIDTLAGFQRRGMRCARRSMISGQRIT